MTDDAATLKQFFSQIDVELDKEMGATPYGAEVVLTRIKLLFPETFAQMEKEGVLKYLDNPEGLRAYLHGVFKKYRESPLPDHVEPHASEVSPREVTKRAEAYENAAKETRQALDSRSERIDELRASYVKRVTQNFIDQTRQYYDRQASELSDQAAAQIKAAEKAAAEIPNRVNADKAQTYIRQIEDDLPQYSKKDAVRVAALDEAREAEKQYNDAVRQYDRAQRSAKEAKKQFFGADNPTTEPAILFTKAIELSDATPYTIPEIVGIAELQARAVEFKSIDATGVTMGGHGLWETLASQGGAREKALAPLADFIFDNLRPEQQMGVVRDVIDRSLGRFEKPIAGVMESLGERVATSNAMRSAIQSGDLSRGASASANVGGLAASVFGSFGGLNVQTIEIIGNSGAIDWLSTQSMYAFTVAQKLKTSLGTAGKFALKEGAEALAKKAGGFGFKKLIGGTLGSVFGGPVGAVVGSFVMDTVIGTAIEWGGKAFSAAGYLASGGVLSSILQGKPASLTDTFVLLPIIIVILLIALFAVPILPFLNFTDFPQTVRNTALVQSMGGEGPDGTPTDCDKTPDAPVCSFEVCEGDCKWPTSGIITQGPRPSCGSHSGGEDENGIDIASNSEPTVFAMVDGTVDAVNASCDDYSGSIDENDPAHSCGGGYGNFVVVTGKASNGKTYKLIFGHMLSNIPVSVGDGVTPKTPVGKMDHTGYSSGAHLHFGVLSGGSVLDLVPDNDPFDKSLIDGCNASCGKACPATPVSSG